MIGVKGCGKSYSKLYLKCVQPIEVKFWLTSHDFPCYIDYKHVIVSLPKLPK
jgi:hypothetical protein